MGTLGGNLANASPLGDLTVIFMALDADLRLSGPDGERVVRLKDFYTGYKKTRLAPAEIIETVAFDLPSAGSRFSFEKTSKRVHDMARPIPPCAWCSTGGSSGRIPSPWAAWGHRS